MISIIQKAAMVATHAHHKQVRKYKPIPYINHPAEVAKIIQSYDFPDYMIAAAWLHDVVEDTDLTIADLQIHFDYRVTDLVVELTNTAKPEDGTRRVRMGINQARLAKVSENAQTIKLVDVWCNTRDICHSDHPDAVEFAPVWLHEKHEPLTVMRLGDPRIRAMTEDLIHGEIARRRKAA